MRYVSSFGAVYKYSNILRFYFNPFKFFLSSFKDHSNLLTSMIMESSKQFGIWDSKRNFVSPRGHVISSISKFNVNVDINKLDFSNN